jgi:hypothetical protein
MSSIASVSGRRWISSGAVRRRFSAMRRKACVTERHLMLSVLPTERAHAAPA